MRWSRPIRRRSSASQEDRALAAAAAVKGIVVLGPETRVIAEMQNDQLTIFYLIQIVNSARTPVDIGGPLVFDLPREARGATVMEGSSPQATANGPRITVTGPFAPGVTSVQAAYKLPYSGGTARIEQKMPAAWQQATVIVQQLGGLSLASPQLPSTQDVNDQGQALILGSGPGLAAGQSLTIEISGLPHRAVWPQEPRAGARGPDRRRRLVERAHGRAAARRGMRPCERRRPGGFRHRGTGRCVAALRPSARPRQDVD